MSLAALTLALVTFTIIGLLPQFFFRSDGKFNLRWWGTAAPFFAAPLLLLLGQFGYLTPLTDEGHAWRDVVASGLLTLSAYLIGLTVGTNRVPLALWHQENDAPVNIVTFGAYRLIRHPFYSSFLVAMLGAVVLFPHVLTIALFVYMFFALNLTAAREERRLSASPFGTEYIAYIGRTGRFFSAVRLMATKTSAALIELRDVQKTYRLGETEVPALRGVDLTVRGGEFMSLVGASGSGKSTLLNIVGCIDEPTKGAVSLEGRDVLALSEREKARLRNRKIGFVFQTFNLVPVLDVAENIELPLSIQTELSKEERSKRVASALADVGLSDFVKHLPDRLSGGQRQRVAIARALVTNPALVIADEPTANLDSGTANRIVDLLLELNEKRGVTFLFSTHDEKLMARVTRLVRIKDGRIEE